MTIRDFLLGVGVMIIWGFNFSAIKLGADQTNPILLTAMRFSFAILPAIFFIAKPKVKWRYILGYGFCFGVGVWGMMTWSITIGVSAGMAGLVLQLNIVASLLLAWLLLKEHISWQKSLGAFFAVIGLVISLFLEDGSVPLEGLVFILIAALSWAVMNYIVKRSGTTEVFAFSVWGMLFAPFALSCLAFGFHGSQVFVDLPGQLNQEVWFSILFQAYPTTLLGYWIWNRLLLKYPMSTVSPLTMLVPIFGLIGSVIFYQEQISYEKYVAAMFILSGVVLSQLSVDKLRSKYRLLRG
ncbi:EamA family transporter [Agaribacter flavus]|uniref:EamA family transporter n=1 Tax=Agaribacter flavus TaxID=1902781 RepID=A0ABV7FMM6_9ALTE